MEGNDATLCVAVLDGQIGRNVPISFETQPGTATGTWTSNKISFFNAFSSNT